MSRRDFLTRLYTSFKALALLTVLPSACTAATGAARDREKLHYTPLNGLTLREVAARKMHHGPNGLFLNPLGSSRRRRSFGRLLYWKLFGNNRFGGSLDEQPVVPVEIDWRAIAKQADLSVTFLKHASVLIKDRDQYILVDPVFDDIFRFIKDFTPMVSGIERMPRPDHVLITHGHYDHLDVASLRRLDADAHVISPLGYDDLFDGLALKNRSRLDWYESHRVGQRVFTLLPCNHWTMRNPLVGPNRALWGSYLIQTASGPTIYLSGDTAWFDGFDQIGREFDIDLAIVNLGAYEPRWFMAASHMNAAETVAAFKQLKARKLMIVHWGTFRLGDEPVHYPPSDLARELEKYHLRSSWADIRHGETYAVR